MKLVLGSDLHLEHYDKEEVPPVPECDLLVLAGDIYTGDSGLEWAKTLTEDTPTVYVPGNHEYYGWEHSELNEIYSKFEDDNVMLLAPGVVEVGDFVFIGCTLRSALVLPGYAILAPARWAMNIGDFHVSPNWTPYTHVDQHLHEVQFIESMLEKYSDKRCIVVTHFVPTMQCVAPRWVGSPITPFFVNDLDWLINKYKPEAWLFGHTHDSYDQLHSNSKTRLICNPRGYPGEKADKFEWKTLEF